MQQTLFNQVKVLVFVWKASSINSLLPEKLTKYHTAGHCLEAWLWRFKKIRTHLCYYFYQSPGQAQELYFIPPIKLEQFKIILQYGIEHPKDQGVGNSPTGSTYKTSEHKVIGSLLEISKCQPDTFISGTIESSEGSSCFLGCPERSGLSSHISVHVHISVVIHIYNLEQKDC